jgi:hypothetical protein
MKAPFKPTEEQALIIGHMGSAFISACPGSGKTRVLVERARMLLLERTTGKGIAFLSFTNAAVSVLEQRLRKEGILPSPLFPNFIGTFDSFLWQFLVMPFGIPGCDGLPRLVPDKEKRTVRPFHKMRALPLSCFDRVTGELITEAAQRLGFEPNPNQAQSYAKIAASTRARFLQRGELDFTDVRKCAVDCMRNKDLSSGLARALASRFRELIVDEAQDCNPEDLAVIQWLRNAGIAIKVICDPYQSIYEFRGGVTEELIAFGRTFDEAAQLTMSGNFRSSDSICKAIVALRHPDGRSHPDRALGEHNTVRTPIYILAYPGNGVPSTVGTRFLELLKAEGIGSGFCPVLAATRDSGAKAIGQPTDTVTQDLTLRLAIAVSAFHFAFETGNRKEALEEVHRVVLAVEGRLDKKTYHQYLVAEGIKPDAWRPRILKLARELRYDPALYPNADTWHSRAKALLAPYLPENSKISIAQRLRRNSGLSMALCMAPASSPPAKTIHAVKGMEFPAVCVVMTTATAKGILDYLQTGSPHDSAQEARRIYVAASRAQRLLVIAAPRSQAKRLEAHLCSMEVPVRLVDIDK